MNKPEQKVTKYHFLFLGIFFLIAAVIFLVLFVHAITLYHFPPILVFIMVVTAFLRFRYENIKKYKNKK